MDFLRKYKLGRSTLLSVYSVLTQFCALLSAFLFLCLKIDLLDRLPERIEEYVPDSVKSVLIELDPFWMVGSLGLFILISPDFLGSVIRPFFSRTRKDVLSWLGAVCFFAVTVVLINQYDVQEWPGYIEKYLSEGEISQWLKLNLLVLIKTLGFSIAWGCFAFTEWFYTVIFLRIKASLWEAKRCTFPAPQLALRFAVLVAVGAIFFSFMIAGIDSLSLRVMTFVLSWISADD